jgi:4-alpha-glucanotransferase
VNGNALTPEMLEKFSASPTGSHWEHVGLQSRAGVSVPLFSLYSARSAGIGELTDLRLLVDWCRACGLSIIQLLPLNDVGFNFTPYDAQTMFGLDPMYLSLEGLAGLEPAAVKPRLEDLRSRFPAGRERVDYRIKQAKLEHLWSLFHSRSWSSVSAFTEYRQANAFWLPDFALYKVLKNAHEQRHWEEWEEPYRRRDAQALREFQTAHPDEILFQAWLQWQLAGQFQALNRYARKQGVRLMGDLPFLVSHDSADVWSHQNYFKLELAAGAPPDAYQAHGQRWGMPPYDWNAIAARGYDYLVQKLRYAENFYDFYRIDHFVGIFRLWTIPLSEPSETAGLHGRFDPADETLWEGQGRRLLEVMLQSTAMLPCAEDLGVIPACSYKVLEEYAVVGMDVQRWCKDWDRTNDFKAPAAYRANSIAVISTHDMSTLQAWWENEAGTIDECLFRDRCPSRGLNADALLPRLFDPRKSRDGRLAWRQEINSVEVLWSVLERRPEDVKDFSDMYLSTYSERAKFWAYLGLEGQVQERFTSAFAARVLELANRSCSLFSIQLLQDWLAFTGLFSAKDARAYRINVPGTIRDSNWSLVMPFSLEELLALPDNQTLLELNQKTGRTPPANF